MNSHIWPNIRRKVFISIAKKEFIHLIARFECDQLFMSRVLNSFRCFCSIDFRFPLTWKFPLHAISQSSKLIFHISLFISLGSIAANPHNPRPHTVKIRKSRIPLRRFTLQLSPLLFLNVRYTYFNVNDK